jgi:alkylation response protein AidB-like acyl-CoA dehydrogenase
MHAEVAACDALVWVAGRALDAGTDAEIRHLVHLAKGRASATLPGVVESAILIHGASGFAEETGLGQAWRRAISLAASFGTAAGHRAAVAGANEGTAR